MSYVKAKILKKHVTDYTYTSKMFIEIGKTL